MQDKLDMNIPSNLVVISNVKVSELTENELTSIIYQDWFSAKNYRMGNVICIDVNKSPVGLPTLEDEGFLMKDTQITLIPNDKKKWGQEFYI